MAKQIRPDIGRGHVRAVPDFRNKLTVYEKNGQKRYAVLYADSKWDGYYLLREITGLPELVDGEYSAVLAELEDIIGLTVPVSYLLSPMAVNAISPSRKGRFPWHTPQISPGENLGR